MKANLKMIAVLFASLLLGLTACDNKQEGPNNGGTTGEHSYLSLSLQLPNAGSLLAGVDGVNHGQTYVGTEAESIVSKVLVAFYQGDNCKSRAILDAKSTGSAAFTGDDVASGSTKTKLVTKAVEVPALGATQSYDVVVFFNPTSDVESRIQVGSTKAELEKVSIFDMNKVVSAANGIMMSNAKSYVNVPAAKLYDTKEAAEAAAAEKVSVTVERAVAKVFVNPAIAAPTAGGNISGATLALKGWLLDCTNKKLFNMRKLPKALEAANYGTSTAAAKLIDEALTTPRIDCYAEDPNYSGYSAGSYDTENFVYLNATPDPTANPTGLPALFAPGYDDDKGKYVAENTMDAALQYRDGTTLALFAIEVTPKAWKSATETEEPTANYIVYNGTAYTIDYFKSLVDLTINVTDPKLQQMPSTFVDDVQAFGVGSSSNGISELKNKIDAAITAKAPFSEHNVKLYVDKINYYNMPIRHFTDEQQAKKMEYGRYGIVRNNIYKLTVNKVTNFGEPIVPEPGHDKDDPEMKYISMSVELLPWLVRVSGYDL